MNLKRVDRIVLVAAFIAVVSVVAVFAQERIINPVSRIARISTALQATPEFSVSDYDTEKGRKNWLELRVDYEIAPEWVDELEFIYYVYFRTKTGRAKNMLFKHSVTYMDIERGRHISKVYIHPNTYTRYVKEIVYVGVEIRYRGRPVKWISDKSKVRDTKWWEQAQNVMPPVSGKILDRDQTPFSLINPDDYELRKTKN
jgi:hypothetical protein